MTEQENLDDFEKSLEKLEEIVAQMEDGSLTLEQSLKAFEEGVKLTQVCQKRLESAEQRVAVLMQDGTEEILSEPSQLNV